MKGLEDGRRRRLDDDGNAVAELGAASGGFECRRWRNSRAMRHERTSCGCLSETHEPCRLSPVTGGPYQAVAPRSRPVSVGKSTGWDAKFSAGCDLSTCEAAQTSRFCARTAEHLSRRPGIEPALSAGTPSVTRMQQPFTKEQFFDLFAAYNVALWPGPHAPWIASVVVGGLLVSSRRPANRWISALLTAHRALVRADATNASMPAEPITRVPSYTY